MDNRQIQRALEVALAAAAAGAGELMAGYGRRPAVRYKAAGPPPGSASAEPSAPRSPGGAFNPVTEYDLKSEEVIRGLIARTFPEHLLVGEEEGRSGFGRSDYKWYIDPLDGTTNFVRGHPFFAVSIGLVGPDRAGGERPLVGVISAPALGELYWGFHQGGAWRRLSLPGRGLTENRLAVADTADLRGALLHAGFPCDISDIYDISDGKLTDLPNPNPAGPTERRPGCGGTLSPQDNGRGGELLQPFGRLAGAAGSVRRSGSVALDVAYVAAGLADAFWETGPRPWDVAAGLLLLDEAGGRASDCQGRPYELGLSRDILGSNGLLHERMLACLA